MSKGDRRTKARDVAAERKRTKAATPASTQHLKPLFCFEHADRGSTEAWAFRPDEPDAAEMLYFICDMAKLTWADILRQETGTHGNRHRKHHEQDVNTIAVDAQGDLKRCKLGETFGESIFRFRLSGEKRLWGFRDGRTFHVVWWDPGHNVYGL